MIGLILAAAMCTAVPYDAHHGFDGVGGFVYKPTGDHFPTNAVVVLPHKYVGNGASVLMLHGAGVAAVCPLKTNGICPDSPECLSRPTFSCSHSGKKLKEKYPDGVTVEVHFKGVCTHYQIKDPSRRYD